MKKIKLALIAGGTSGEREVSLKGAAEIEKVIDPEKYQLKIYDPATDLKKLVADGPGIDAAFIILHGIGGEDGTIQGLLEMINIPYQGSDVLGSALAMDKNLAKEIYQQHNLPVAEWQMAKDWSWQECRQILSRLSLPLIVKPLRQGSSLGMSVVSKEEELSRAIELGFEHDNEVMVERFISGREITVGVIEDNGLQALPVVEIIPNDEFDFFDYRAKYNAQHCREICPAEIDEQLTKKAQDYAIAAHNALKLKDYSRTDMIIDGEDLIILETNTIPGMTPTSLFPLSAKEYGLSFDELIEKLISLALAKQECRKNGDCSTMGCLEKL